MRNTLQEQYNLLKEGKMNKQHFFKSARHLFPDLITPTNSFTDAVTILKNRGVISEGIGGLVTTGRKQDWHAIFNENIDKLKKENKEEDEDEELARRGDEEAQGKEDLHALPNKGSLKEAKEAKAEEKETTKEVTDMATRGYDYKDEKNYDNLFGQEFLKGYYTELKDPKNADKDVEELKAIVAKNLAKDNQYYVKDGQFGVKGVGYQTEAPGLGTPKEPKGKYKSSGYGDLKESVLRLAIQDIIKEVITEGLDKEAIKAEGEEAKKNTMKRRITNEIVKRKKKMKALQTLTELDGEENDDHVKKVKEIQSEIKQLEGMAAKLDGKNKKKVTLDERTKEEIETEKKEVGDEMKTQSERQKDIANSVNSLKTRQSQLNTEKPTDTTGGA
jgi:hypothetical protein